MQISGTGAGLVGTRYAQEFKLLAKADLIAKDKLLTQLFQDSENGKVPYKLPFRAVDGAYNGCAKCNVAGLPSHGGSVAGAPATTTTAGTTKTTTAGTTKTTTTKATTTTASATTTTTESSGDDGPPDWFCRWFPEWCQWFNSHHPN